MQELHEASQCSVHSCHDCPAQSHFCILQIPEVEMNNRRLSGYATVFCALLTLAGSAGAQDATLSARIMDATDAVLPGATGTALQVATGTSSLPLRNPD